MNARADHPAICPSIAKGIFDAAVVLAMESERVFVDNAAQARSCLSDHFLSFEGPCFERAMATCEASIVGHMSGAAARFAFVAAAMEAGFPFEVIEDRVFAFETRTEFAVEHRLRSLLFEEDHCACVRSVHAAHTCVAV